METLVLAGLVTAAGYYFKDSTTRNNEGVRNIDEKDPDTSKMSELEKPNSLNIYNSDKVNASNDEVLQRSLNNYKNAENPAVTGVLPPIYNSYSSIGNDNLLSTKTNFLELNSIGLAKTEDFVRRNNTELDTSRQLEKRPMFNPSNFGSDLNLNAPTEFAKTIENQNINLLTGKPYEKEHSNMVPFFSSNITQNIESFTNESKLDNFTGNTSTFFHKKEAMPLFEQVTENIFGAPLLTDHIDTSRFIPSAFRQNEKPFYEERIAAPISGTFENPVNQNFERSIDDLRVASKQQISYEGRTKAGQMGSVRGATVPVNKNRPETHFELGHDRLFTTTGAIVADKSSDNYENMTKTSRQSQNLEYYGVAGNTDQIAQTQRVCGIDNTHELDFSSIAQLPKRTQLHSDTTRNLTSQTPGVNDHGLNSYNLPELERDTTNQLHTLNINKSNSGHQRSLDDTAKTTNKETLVNKRDNRGNVKTRLRETNTGYTDYEVKTTQKETLVHNKYKGHVNKKDGMGYNIAKYNAKTTNKEITSDIAYNGHANDNNKNNMIRSTFEKPIKVRHAAHAKYYRGHGKHGVNSTENRNRYENAEITEKKEVLLNNRPSGPKSSLGSISGGVNSIGELKLTQNMLLKEEDKTRLENMVNSNVIISKESLGALQTNYNKHSEVENSRLTGDLISAQLKDNPFYNLR